jgi:PPE-repeat protein
MSVSAGVRRSVAEPDAAAASAGAATEERARRRRRRTGLVDRGHRHEYLDPAAASEKGAGALGFAGTARDAGAEPAAGLTTLAGDSLGGGPAMPMMPSTWSVDADESGK